MVTIAYWDTQQEGRPPRLLGEIQGTPTIRLFKPKKKQSNPKSNSQKTVIDYRYERKAKDMLTWIEENMTNYVETVKFGMDDFKKIQAKASKFGIPMAVFFTTKPKTTALLKSLSTEYRRRVLLVQVALPIAKNQPVLEEFGLPNGSGASLVIVPPTGDHVTYTDGDFSRRKLNSFLKEHAAKDPVYEPIEKSSSDGKTASSDGSSSDTTSTTSTSSGDPPKKKVHTEL
eukprot:CAMPEP_0113456952 /NCGR_PEP_ID=MMETSP0014_2-20120614/9154_1 /TAXON_ID=2857 /ORGANISM="Nitzschia sp." /LENGTH=228 /DNA_ID=CAMNT_0000348425 /DNA_START=352 /DNA_END=1038 /DNA_ORIENTATION=- /assembly_acc=CAM_ASM_000159